MRKERFESMIRELLPEASDAAMKNWTEYAQELDQEETEPETDFYDSTYVELSLIKQHQGLQTATELFNYGEHFVFNYFELRGAAALLNDGWSLERISHRAVEEGCDATPEEIEEYKTALREFQCGEWDIRENKRKFSSELPQGIRQLYELEQELGGQDGLFCEWIRSVYEVNEDFERSFAESIGDLCGAFRDASQKYGHVLARQLYNAQTVILPTEIRNAAQYLSLGGRLDHIPALAEVGFLMGDLEHDAVLRAVEYMDAGGDAAYACHAAHGKAQFSKSDSCAAQWQQTM